VENFYLGEPIMINQKIQYFRNRKNNKVGCFVGVADEKNFTVGWSLCCPRDNYNKELGVELATGRACKTLLTGENHHKLPHSMKEQFSIAKIRFAKYFKDKKFLS
jgi:hypothetical protein